MRWACFLVIVAGLAGTFRRPLFQGNFGIVDPGRAYRSAQPNSSLDATIRHLGLRSVVDLRGGTESDAFYRNEVEVTGRLGVNFYDIPMSASRRPSRRDLLRIVWVLDHAPKPLLIHCKWGADRTGLMSALYRLIVLAEPPEKAINEFSLSYGHVPIRGPEKLHEPIDEYARWLKERGLSHDPQRFRDWLEKDYRSDDTFQQWPDVLTGPRPRHTQAAKSEIP